jgi:hypothetical protein
MAAMIVNDLSFVFPMFSRAVTGDAPDYERLYLVDASASSDR